MIVSNCIGLFAVGLLNNDLVGGMILFALISGIACINTPGKAKSSKFQLDKDV